MTVVATPVPLLDVGGEALFQQSTQLRFVPSGCRSRTWGGSLCCFLGQFGAGQQLAACQRFAPNVGRGCVFIVLDGMDILNSLKAPNHPNTSVLIAYVPLGLGIFC